MIRQCAWCLRLIDGAGARISQQPLPKLYEASHGMCSACGWLWMGQVSGSAEPYADPEEHTRSKRLVAEEPSAPLQDTPAPAQVFNEEMDTPAPIINRRE
jgi:hypothetical protein